MTKGKQRNVTFMMVILLLVGVFSWGVINNQKETSKQDKEDQSKNTGQVLKQATSPTSSITTNSDGQKVVVLKSGLEADVKLASEFMVGDNNEPVEKAYKEFLKGTNLDLEDPKNAKDKEIIEKNSQDAVFIYKGRFYYKGQLANGFFNFTVTDGGETCIPFDIVDGIIVYLFNDNGLLLNTVTNQPETAEYPEDEEIGITDGKFYTVKDGNWQTVTGNGLFEVDIDLGKMEDGLFVDIANEKGANTLIPRATGAEFTDENIEKLYFDETKSDIILKSKE